MIWLAAKRGVEKGLAGRFVAAAVRLNRDKYGVDLRQLLRIVKAQYPAAVLLAVLVENAEIDGRSLGRFVPAPRLEGHILDARLPVEIEGVKDERLALGVEDAAVGLARAAVARHVKYVRHVELS